MQQFQGPEHLMLIGFKFIVNQLYWIESDLVHVEYD